jgi:hypothetical protein
MNTKALMLLHALLAGYVAGLVTTMACRGLTRGVEWDLMDWLLAAAVPVCLAWFVFSVSLFFRQRWAWWGSLSVVLLIYALLGYVTGWPVLKSVLGWRRNFPSDPIGLFELIGISLMIPFAGALALLFFIRRQIFSQKRRQRLN